MADSEERQIIHLQIDASKAVDGSTAATRVPLDRAAPHSA
jgi:hypothetical protein